MELELIDKPTAPASQAALRYARAVVGGLIRLELRGEVKPRLTEPKLATWNLFRGRLGARHLLELLLEDGAVGYPVPCDARFVLGPDARGLVCISDAQVEAWAKAGAAAQGGKAEDADAFLVARAKDLGLPSRVARSEMQKIKPHHKVLELPGTGGLLAHWALTHNEGLFLDGAFHIACGTWQELTLAGLVAMERGDTNLQHRPIRDMRQDPKLESLRRTKGADADAWRYDFVLGLATAKGGTYAEGDLARWFPGATIQLL